MIRGTRRPGGAGRTRGGRSGAKGGKGGGKEGSGNGGICGLIFGLFLMLTAGLCLIGVRLVAG